MTTLPKQLTPLWEFSYDVWWSWNEAIPLVYQCNTEGIPREWVGRMKETIVQLAPVYTTHRTVHKYGDGIYLPDQTRCEELGNNRERVQQRIQWKTYVRSKWTQIKIVPIDNNYPDQLKVGMQRGRLGSRCL